LTRSMICKLDDGTIMEVDSKLRQMNERFQLRSSDLITCEHSKFNGICTKCIKEVQRTPLPHVTRIG
jgi:hypothetical protein